MKKMAILAGALCCAALSGCQREQLLVSIDTDALLAGELRGVEGLPPDGVLDALRIEILGAGGEVIDLCEHHAAERDSWPVTFGVAPADEPRLLRVRFFQRALAGTAPVPGVPLLCGEPLVPGAAPLLSAPPPDITVDRVAELPRAGGGTRRLALHLPLSCMGVAASILDRRSCVDGADASARDVPFADPRQWADEDASHRVDRSPLLSPSGCTLSPPSGIGGTDVVCVPGGFYIMGDRRLATSEEFLAPRPLRPVYLSSFYMDRLEVSVGRMKKLLSIAMGRGITLTQPHSGTDYPADSLERTNCTWNLPAAYAEDRLPVNCITPEAARAVCRFVGGDLPSEAQWEYAARGRGRRWPYPWGEGAPSLSPRCCKSAIGRLPFHLRPAGYKPDPINRCGEYGPALVGSYPDSACAEGGDTSVDGVMDLAGNVAEYLRDELRAYRERCGLQAGVSADPVCEGTGGSKQAQRGDNWFTGSDWTSLSAARGRPFVPVSSTPTELPSMLNGFRCVYPGRSP